MNLGSQRQPPVASRLSLRQIAGPSPTHHQYPVHRRNECWMLVSGSLGVFLVSGPRQCWRLSVGNAPIPPSPCRRTTCHVEPTTPAKSGRVSWIEWKKVLRSGLGELGLMGNEEDVAPDGRGVDTATQVADRAARKNPPRRGRRVAPLAVEPGSARPSLDSVPSKSQGS